MWSFFAFHTVFITQVILFNVGTTLSTRISNQSPIRRIYGKRNAAVRREVSKIENSGTYGQTGILNPQHRVEYLNHPFDPIEKERKLNEQLNLQETEIKRDLTESTNSSLFHPIRIALNTDALDNERNARNTHQIDLIKNEILPRTISFWESTLSVVPISNNLIIGLSDLAGKEYCGDAAFAKVPSSHTTIGVEDADLILYVSGNPDAKFCGEDTLAVAVACNFDQFDRPIAGAINFCLSQVDVDSDGTAPHYLIDDNVDVAIHEAAHVLGMSSNSYRYFWDSETGEPRTKRPFLSKLVVCVDDVERYQTLPDENTMKFFTAENGQRYASIVTPKVKTVTRNHFNCQSLEGAQLENQPTGSGSCTGDHWDERMFYPEALSGVISPTANIMSPITLALLEDSGWYVANFNNSRISPWGLSVGCDFVTKDCLNKEDSSIPSYGRGFFCNDESSRGCSPNHNYKMGCTLIDYKVYYNSLPQKRFQYFSDYPALGGPEQADYCPVFGTATGGKDIHQLDCREPTNRPTVNIYSEDYRHDSMCFEVEGSARCYISKCVLSEMNLRIFVLDTWYICNHDFQEIDVDVTSGWIERTITCPRISSMCPDMFCPANCAARGICNYTAVVNGTIRPKCECFDKNDTSLGCSVSLPIDGKYLDDPSGLLIDLPEKFLDPLFDVFRLSYSEWSTASCIWAGGLCVMFVLMVSLIFSCFCRRKEKIQAQKEQVEQYKQRS